MRRQLYILVLLITGMLMLSVNFTSTHQMFLGSSTVSAAMQGPSLVNLALNRSATQSSTDTVSGIYAHAGRAVDGNINGNIAAGSVSQTLSEIRPWWEVDLGAVSFIDNVEVRTRSDCCVGEIKFAYILVSEVPFVSNDLNTTLNQPDVMNSRHLFNTAGPHIFSLNQRGRYIRVQVDMDNQMPLHLAEVQVLGLTLQTAPSIAGQWSQLQPLPDIPVHISLLPNRKLLFWGRDKALNSTNDVDGGCKTYLFDPSKVDNPSTPTQDERVEVIDNIRTNLFCSAHSFLPDGKLFVAGGYEAPIDSSGNKRYDMDGHGTRHTNIFNYLDGTWSPGPDMNLPRWYPSVATLNNGETLIVAGDYVSGFNGSTPIRVANRDTEILERNQDLPMRGSLLVDVPNYPFVHLGPDGNVLVVSGTNRNGLSYITSTNTWEDPSNLNLNQSHDQGTSVMYAQGKIMAIGGRQGGGSVTKGVNVIDLNQSNPSWAAADPMRFQRYYATSVLMPDGQVFVVGGSRCGGANNLRSETTNTCTNGAIMHPEIYNPVTGSWSIMARQQVVRMYHSVALLLPDARIMVTGGGRPGAFGENGVLGVDRLLAHREAEIFSPPYLFTSATRPTITSSPPIINYGQSFSVGIGNVPASQIGQVVLVRLPSVTHALNFDQRRVVLPTPTLLNQQTLSVTAPANGNECPPGPYMLFVLGQNGVPSVAEMISVNPVLTATLTVTSTPISGVSITVTPNDNNGQGSGATTFTRTYNRNTSVTLTAPLTAGGKDFSAWQRDGVIYSTTSNVSVVMDANHTMNAVYVTPPPITLTVTSNPSSGVGITVTPNDNNGQGSGVTTFTRTYNRNTSVTLTAPLTAGAANFQSWQRDGVNFSTSPNVSVVMDINHIMNAVYVVPHTVTLTVTSSSDSGVSANGIGITVTPDDINGRGNGAIPFTRTYNRNTSVTLTASMAVESKYFQDWLRDGVYFSGNQTVTITMDANHTMSPIYRTRASGGLRSSNLALATTGAVASASSTFSSAYPASAVNDGDRKGINWGNGGGWHDGTANSYPDWIQIDFGRNVLINEIIVYTVQDNYLSPIEPTPNMTFSLYGITAYAVQYWDGTSWVTMRNVINNNLVGRVIIYPFSTGFTRKIRVLINNALQSYSRVTEIEAYAYGGPAPPR
jgi:hypothetical protein